jgi:hypothetical protein
MKRFIAVVAVAVIGLAGTQAYAQGGCMHGGGGSMSGMGGTGMTGIGGLGMSGMGGLSGIAQQGYMQNQYAQQQFLQQLYMQNVMEQQQMTALALQRSERRAEKIAMIKERRAAELAKKNGVKPSTSSPAATKNLSEAILAGNK